MFDNQPGYKPGVGLMCSYCGEMRHSKQRCYEIIGYPDWWDFMKKSRKNIGKSMANLTETNQVRRTTNVVHPGIIGKKFTHSVITKNSTWIIDTDASSHMISDSDKLT